MKTEKVIISFITSLIGILAAALAFYFYQSTKVIPQTDVKTITLSPSPKTTPQSKIFLALDAPVDEEVTDKKVIEVSGTTNPDTVIIVTSSISDKIVTPAQNGSFTTTITLDDGENEILVTAIATNGEETTLIRTVTVSSETF